MSLADAMKDMEEFRVANLELASGKWRFETRGPPPPEVTHSRRVEPMRSYRISASATPPSPWKQSSSSSNWGESDPELKRQRRVVKYKSYAYERKVKDSVMSGFRWMKNKYSELAHRY
ncbi:hypothetical protein K2173_022377 [Erythroxylum novogranatense]|uniref:Uncharacterized protein n=1 Tax=Erythroxylum novogranatense TaxID=1862640 RepID=A0AAV8THT3_9ROSI|nr:hypothetical protein K2173_022377 [Erythroxylum novogranatense]